jgi:membrane peptidoglycan carboxypeptidase
LDETLDIGLPAYGSNLNENEASSWKALLEGNNALRISPLQAAYAASIFSNHGQQALPQILSSINTQEEGWIVVSSNESYRVIPSEEADNMAILMASSEIPGWEMSTQSEDEQGQYTWYIAGTPSNWTSTPIVLVLASENASAEELRQAGRAIFNEIIES